MRLRRQRRPSWQITLDVAPFLVSQDTATALAFLITEIIELGMACDPAGASCGYPRAKARARTAPSSGSVRLPSPEPVHDALVEQRYGRVMQGLARQLRAPLTHDGQLGAYEVTAQVRGRE